MLCLLKSSSLSRKKLPPEILSHNELDLGNSDLVLFLLKLARDPITSSEGSMRALDHALWASKSFEICVVDGEPSLELVMSLHALGTIYCNLGRFEEAILVLVKVDKVSEIAHTL